MEMQPCVETVSARYWTCIVVIVVLVLELVGYTPVDSGTCIRK
jgi:hypothetical protein